MKKYLLGVFAIALAVGFSAFTKINTTSGKKLTTYYFDYAPASDFSDNALIQSINWSDGRTSEGSDPCEDENINPCTVSAVLSDGLTPAQAKSAFLSMLQSTDPSDYVFTPSNIVHKKP